MIIRFTVPGVPQTAGSKRGFPLKMPDGKLRVRVVDDNPKSRDWKTAVTQTAAENYRGELIECPVALELVFDLVRPKGHFGKRGLLASAPGHPAVKPDVLKLARAVEDALTGVIWRDDALVVEERLVKRYGERAGVSITVRTLAAVEATLAPAVAQVGELFP